MKSFHSKRASIVIKHIVMLRRFFLYRLNRLETIIKIMILTYLYPNLNLNNIPLNFYKIIKILLNILYIYLLQIFIMYKKTKYIKIVLYTGHLAE